MARGRIQDEHEQKLKEHTDKIYKLMVAIGELRRMITEFIERYRSVTEGDHLSARVAHLTDEVARLHKRMDEVEKIAEEARVIKRSAIPTEGRPVVYKGMRPNMRCLTCKELLKSGMTCRKDDCPWADRSNG